MPIRTSNKTVTFGRPFWLKGVDRTLPAGDYRVTTDEELIEGLSFPVYRRVSTMILVPAAQASSVELVTIDPAELERALTGDSVVAPVSARHAAPTAQAHRTAAAGRRCPS